MPSVLKLTPRRVRIYDFILNFKKDHDGLAPTVLEIRNGCGISSTSIMRHDLDTLIVLGMIDYGDGGKSRMIRIPGARWIPPSPMTSVFSPLKAGARVPLSSSKS